MDLAAGRTELKPTQETTESPSVSFQFQTYNELPTVERKIVFAAYKTIPTETRPLVKRLKPPSRRFLATWLLLLGLACIATLMSTSDRSFNMLLNSLFPLVGAITAAWAWAKFHIAPESVRRIMDMPPAQTQYPVQLSFIEKDRKSFVVDRGIITFPDGHLLFEGTRFSLDLDTGVLADPKRLLGFLGHRSRNRTTIPLRTPEVEGDLEIRVYDRIPGIDSRFQTKFIEDLAKWCYQPPCEHATLKLPSKSSDPLLVRKFRRERNLSIGGSFTIALAGAYAEFFRGIPLGNQLQLTYLVAAGLAFLAISRALWDHRLKDPT